MKVRASAVFQAASGAPRKDTYIALLLQRHNKFPRDIVTTDIRLLLENITEPKKVKTE